MQTAFERWTQRMKKVMANELDYPSNHVSRYQGLQGRYEFPFEPGLNVIHGPNGQGKSSVVDSLRWALIGELPKVEAIRAPS